MPPRSIKPGLRLGVSEGRVDFFVELIDDLGECVLGALMPYRWLVSKPGTTSPTVGYPAPAPTRLHQTTGNGKQGRKQ
jgi:hypothetical protein